MSSFKSKYTNNFISNLLGEENHRNYLEFQSNVEIAFTGGHYPIYGPSHIARLVQNINILSSSETKEFFFSTTISN